MSDTVITNALLPSGPGTASLEFESLSNVVEMVSKEETPFLSNMGKGSAKAIKEEWGTETIGVVTAAVARSIGFVAAPTPQVQNRRLDNYLELIAEEGGVSHTMDHLDAADNTNTYEHKLLKSGILLRRKLNKLLHTPQAKDGTIATPKMGTPPAYVQTTLFASVATTPGTPPAGTGADIPGVGTGPDDFDTIVPIDTVLEASAQFNGNPDTAYFSPRMKRLFSRIPDASVADNQVNSTAGSRQAFKHIGVVDAYLSDFGYIETVMDIDCPNTDIKIVDHDWTEILVLPGMDFQDYELGKKGSAQEYMIEWQGTYRNKLPESFLYINGYKA